MLDGVARGTSVLQGHGNVWCVVVDCGVVLQDVAGEDYVGPWRALQDWSGTTNLPGFADTGAGTTPP